MLNDEEVLEITFKPSEGGYIESAPCPHCGETKVYIRSKNYVCGYGMITNCKKRKHERWSAYDDDDYYYCGYNAV